jgi:hypothetical protein
MTDINDGSEPNTETEDVIDLFAEGADDLLTGEQAATEGAATQEPGTPASEDAAEEDTSIPEKFRGKTAAEIAASYMELEKDYGRRGNELGDLRKVTDDILKAQLTPKADAEPAKPASEVTSDDLLENPQAVIDAAVANSPHVKALEKEKADNAAANALARFTETHSDAEKVVADPRFQEWILANPVRAARWNKADNSFDFDTASEIISTFKEVNPVAENNGDAGAAERNAALESVATPAAGAGNPGTTGTKKYLLRSELMKLKQTDPDRYERLQPQIIAAYAEKRVK